MNVWTFTARVGADGELKSTQNGDQLLSFHAANTVGFGDKKTTLWVDCTMWGKRAVSVAPYIVKGQQVAVTGEVTLREFQKKDGTTGTVLAVRVAELELVGSKPGDQQGQPKPPPQQPKPSNGGYGGNNGNRGYAGQKPQSGGYDDMDQEIPF